MRVRVVCTFRETMETFAPTSLLMRVDLPTFGAPTMATKPQRILPFGGFFIAWRAPQAWKAGHLPHRARPHA